MSSSTLLCKQLLPEVRILSDQLLLVKPTDEEFKAWRTFFSAAVPHLPNQRLGSQLQMTILAWKIHHGRSLDITHVNVYIGDPPLPISLPVSKLRNVYTGFVQKIKNDHTWVGRLCDAVHTLKTLRKELPKVPISEWELLLGSAATEEMYLRLMTLPEKSTEDALHPDALVDALLDYDSQEVLRKLLRDLFKTLLAHGMASVIKAALDDKNATLPLFSGP